VSQAFLMDRCTEHRTRGLEAYKRGDWDDARYHLLKAAEYLFRVAGGTSGRLRESRIRNAQKLKELAKRIEPGEGPPGHGAGAPGPGGEARARGAADGAEGEGGARYRQADRPRVRFDDVAGLDEVKEQIRLKLIYPFRHKEAAAKYGIRPGGGVLLYGPPGTGKTLVARAVAGEVDAAFYTVRPSEVLSKWVGDSEKNVAELFRQAREHPVSVIFIDEIEALVPARRESRSTVMSRVVPQILAELEGFATAGSNPLLFLGATNEPWSLDPAVLRPGRFDAHVYVGLPDLAARAKMLELHLEDRPVAGDVDLGALAVRLDGYSGADIRNVCDRAAAEAFLAAVERGEHATIDAALMERTVAAVRPSVRAEDLARFEAYARDI
jgi:transitional endoplasmic reticulum ATPase